MSSSRYLRAHQRELAPVWHDQFATLLWRHLPRDGEGLVLDVHSGTGSTTFELLERLPACRVIGLEPDATLREHARSRIPDALRERVYFRGGELTDVADMAKDAYALVVANMVLGDASDLRGALRGLLRVTAPGGRVMVTLPMQGTWAQAEDLLSEVLLELSARPSQHHEAAHRRLVRMSRRRPSGERLARIAKQLALSEESFFIEQERSVLLFRSGRDFLFSAVVEYGPLRFWKALLPDLAMRQELFWRLKESIDTYYEGRPFAVDVVRGVLVLEKPKLGRAPQAAPTYWQQYPTLDALWTSSGQPELEPEEPSLEMSTDGMLRGIPSHEDNAEDRELDALLERLFPPGSGPSPAADPRSSSGKKRPP